MRTVLTIISVVVLVGLAGCTDAGDDASPDPSPEPTTDSPPPVAGPQDPTADEFLDPCALLSRDDVAVVSGAEVDEGEFSGGEVFKLCTYLLPDGAASVDVALADLGRLEQVGEAVSGDEYIADLRDGAGAGEVAALPGVGDGEAITITYVAGSQAWAWRGNHAVGAYADALADNDAVAIELLERALAALSEGEG